WVADPDLRRAQIACRQARARRREECLYAGVGSIVNLEGSREGKTGDGALHAGDDWLRLVAADQRHLRSSAHELTNGVQVENQVLIERHAPAREHGCERVVGGDIV